MTNIFELSLLVLFLLCFYHLFPLWNIDFRTTHITSMWALPTSSGNGSSSRRSWAQLTNYVTPYAKRTLISWKMSLGEIKKLIVKVNCRLAIKILFTCYVIFIWAAAADFFFAHCVTLNEYFRQIAQINWLEYLGNYSAVRVIQLEFINAAFLTCNIFFFANCQLGLVMCGVTFDFAFARYVTFRSLILFFTLLIPVWPPWASCERPMTPSGQIASLFFFIF